MYKTLLWLALAVLAIVVYENAYACYSNSGLEGLTNPTTGAANTKKYQPYEQLQQNPDFLGIQNAANIAFLKEQVDGIVAVKDAMENLKTEVGKNTASLKSIGEQLQKSSQKLTGRSDPNEPIAQPTPGSLSTARQGPV